MKSARAPEPNKTKEITFYGYSMKAPFERDTPAASETKNRIRKTWTVGWANAVLRVHVPQKEKSLSEMRLTKWSME